MALYMLFFFHLQEINFYICLLPLQTLPYTALKEATENINNMNFHGL